MDGFHLVQPKPNADGICRCPTPRSGHCMVSNDSYIYVFGGYDGVRTESDHNQGTIIELWKFNFSTGVWTEIDAVGTPDTCASSCLHIHDHQLYVYGGSGYPFGEMMSNTIKICDLRQRHGAKGQTCSWNLIETNPNIYDCTDKGDQMPPRGYGQSVILRHDGIYIFAGAIGLHKEPVSDLHKLNLYTMTWEELSPTGNTPRGRYKQEIAQDNDRFYVFGGGRLSSVESLEHIHAYNFDKNHWDIIKSVADPVHGFPKSRCSFGLIQVGKDVYICGGRHYYGVFVGQESSPMSDVWKFSLVSHQWQCLPIILPEPLFFHAVTFVPSGHMYLFGGVKSNDRRSSSLYKWRVPYFLPKLSELCWDKLMQCYNNLHHCDSETLQDIGIPWTFYQRLVEL